MLRSDDEAGAAKEDESDEAGWVMESIGAAGDGADLSIEALDAAVVEAGGHVADDAFEVGRDGPGELLER